MDPAFWTDPAPLAAGDPELSAWCSREPALRGHVLFRTSGSSGAPKWIALSRDALLLTAAAVNRHLGVDETSCWGLCLPLHHVGGFGVAARTFEAACRLEKFAGKWEPQAFAEKAGRAGVTHLSLVPTQVHDLVAADLRAPASLRAVVVGGGRLDEPTGRAARELGWPVLASYGMTETGSQIATQPPECVAEPYRIAPIPLIPIWDAACDGNGRLRVKGPALFTGAVVGERGGWKFVPRAGEWHETNDRVEIGPGGITPCGRLDAVVKVLGELVDPEAVERELTALSEGRLAPGSFAVAAVPDARLEHRLVPVFSASSDRDVVERTVAAYNRAAPGFRRLGAPVIVDALPLSELGKIRRKALRELFS